MKKNTLGLGLIVLAFLGVNSAFAEVRNVNLGGDHQLHTNSYHGGEHVRSGGENYRGNNSYRTGSDRLNNDTVNVNRNVGNGDGWNGNTPQYRGWNEGPVGWGNGWNSGWNNGYSNGGFWTGLTEGIIGGIAATALFNAIFDHNSTPSVAYANGGGGGYSSGSSYSGDGSNGQPTENVTNNTTTVIDDGGSDVGYWLFGLGALIFAGLGFALLSRRKNNNVNHVHVNDYHDDYDDNDYYEDDRPHKQRHIAHDQSRQYNGDYDELRNRRDYSHSKRH